MLKILHKLKWIDWLLIGGIFLIALGIGWSIKESAVPKTEVVVKNEVKTQGPALTKVMVDVEGEVINPGIYSLDSGARISDVLVAAGGLALKADRDWVDKNLNKAELLMDGQKIFIPNQSENKEFLISNVKKVAGNQIISLNSAGVEELDKLSGVGPAIAQRIIDYRVKNGGFKNVEEIKLVPGVGDKMYEKIKNQIKL
ncbi:MAG: helix-hairpin-helix domain-containing protein [Candidatus Shapirobacteria bacterium]